MSIYIGAEYGYDFGLIYPKEINNLPTVKFAEKTAEWTKDDECSNCGKYVYVGDRDNYCPHCGARMKGEQTE